VRFSPKLKETIESARVSGLDPKDWIIVEAGVSREEVKESFLASGMGFTSQAIQDLTSVTRWILGSLVDAKRVLGAPSRQEVLRGLLGNRELLEFLPEIRRLKRQKDFYKKLDRSIQAARMTYASADERDAQEERLDQTGGSGILRREMLIVITAYEEWLSGNQAWDLPRLLLAATGALGSTEIEFVFPERILVLSRELGESRSEAFFEVLGRRVQVERVFVAESDETAPLKCESKWEEWHTVDDCCDRLGDALLEAYRAGTLSDNGVLLPDLPPVRRSLKRALG